MHVIPYRVFTEGGGPDDAWSRLVLPQPGPGSSVKTALTIRGAVMALEPPTNGPSISHPITGGTRDIPTSLVLPRGTFNLRGEMTHVFVSYRVSTEGGGGNGLSGLLAEKIRALSVDNTHDLHIPRCGWGLWPTGAKQPVPFRPDEAKVWNPKP